VKGDKKLIINFLKRLRAVEKDPCKRKKFERVFYEAMDARDKEIRENEEADRNQANIDKLGRDTGFSIPTCIRNGI
jgi:hypothetical protein